MINIIITDKKDILVGVKRKQPKNISAYDLSNRVGEKILCADVWIHVDFKTKMKYVNKDKYGDANMITFKWNKESKKRSK